MLARISAGLVGGLIVGILAFFLVAIASGTKSETAPVVGLFVAWGLALVLALTAARGGKAWRRLMLSAAVLSLALPLVSLFSGWLSGMELAHQTTDPGTRAAIRVGAVLGAGAVGLFWGFVAFFLALIFAIIGFAVGRD